MEVPPKMKNRTKYDPTTQYFSIFQRKQNTILETHIHCCIKKNDLL